ncbi:Lrp/AsnC family transcriptional regulator [Salipiger mangrovisoli]|uniref:Lrp/AsnC family transcriptional regulator n=1 Tax=Salipiger mangrovisoli TaxID=2865933 RepID=A0ABR9XBF4_9RHOB|nr:Lrp/AsnC family transcriptional regulator [Salipiger mangrovisoli]MBE9640706.1 Lrp/AsnC family transcriptional regulator [Salipiger mangrovisoli]
MLDEADRRILRCIQSNPDITMRELGDATGLSHSPSWRRLQRLKEGGVVGDKAYHIDPEKVGYEIRVLCFVRIAAHNRDRLQAFEDAVQRVPEILQCYSLSGDHDYVLHVVAKSVRNYEETVKNAIVELPNVQSISTSFTLKSVKDTRVIPV